jgi:hypothetical protein
MIISAERNMNTKSSRLFKVRYFDYSLISTASTILELKQQFAQFLPL